MKPRWRPNYTLDEVEALVEQYEEFTGMRSWSFMHVRLIDLDRALAVLRPKERQAVLLCGQMAMTTRTAATFVDASHQTMHRRYRRGIERIVSYLNGGA